MKTVLMVCSLAVCAACGGSDSDGAAAPPQFECAIGQLTGTWRAQYVETNGTCGPIADETFIAGVPDPSGQCTVTTSQVSSDRCRIDIAFNCPTTDGQGTVAWVVVLRQTSQTQLSGTGTVQVNHAVLGTCRSTYDITVTRL